MFRLENNASLFSVRKNKKSKDLKEPAQKHLTFVSRFFVPLEKDQRALKRFFTSCHEFCHASEHLPASLKKVWYIFASASFFCQVCESVSHFIP
jgi:hypothetical protein